MEELILKLFTGGTNVAALAVLLLHWRHDVRITRLETIEKLRGKKK